MSYKIDEFGSCQIKSKPGDDFERANQLIKCNKRHRKKPSGMLGPSAKEAPAGAVPGTGESAVQPRRNVAPVVYD